MLKLLLILIIFATCLGCSTTNYQKLPPAQPSSSHHSKARKLFHATLVAFQQSHIEILLKDPMSMSVVSKWRLVANNLRHRFNVRVISGPDSPRGLEQVNLYVFSQYQQQIHDGLWVDSSDFSLEKRAHNDEFRFGKLIESIYKDSNN